MNRVTLPLLAVTFAVLAAMSTTAHAQVDIVITEPTALTDPTTGEDLVSFILSAETGTSSKITALNLLVSGDLWNIQFDSRGVSPTASFAEATNDLYDNELPADTHGLIADADFTTVGGGFFEPLLTTTTTGVDTKNGVASTLEISNIGLVGGAQSTTVNIAQIVLPSGGAAQVTGDISVQGISTPINIGTFAIPEPGSLALAGLAGLLMLGRRKRRQA